MQKTSYKSQAFLSPKRLLVAGLVLLLALCLFGIDWGALISTRGGKALGRDVRVGQSIVIDWGWPNTHFILQDVEIGNFSQGSDPLMLSVKKLQGSISLKRLLGLHWTFPDLTIEQPSLLLEKDADGNANWQFFDNPSGAVAIENLTPDDKSDLPEIGRLLIRNGQLHFIDPTRKVDLDMQIDTISGRAGKKDNLRLNGNGHFQKDVLTLQIEGGSMRQLQDKDDPYPVKASLQVGKTKISIEGTLIDPIELRGLDLQLTLAGSNAAELFDLTGVALPPTPPYNVTGDLSYADDIWHFNKFKGTMGHSDLAGDVAWNKNGARPLLTGAFVSQRLDFADLGGFVGAAPTTQTRNLSSKQLRQAAKQEASPYVIPDTPLDITRLSAMDADVTFTGKKLISDDLPLDDFFLKVDLHDRVLKTLPVKFGTAKGDIKAFLTVDARQEPVKIDGDFRFTRLMLKPLFAALTDKLGVRNVAEGYIGGTAKLSGTGKSLRGMLGTADGTAGLGMEGGKLSNLVIELLGLDVAQGLGFFLQGDKPVPVRCIIGDFAVKNGLMHVRHFIIDTTDSNIRGQGTINLKNEQLDLKLQTFPKDDTLVSLNSPIALRGTLKDPEIDLSIGGIAARGAVATVLGVLFPPAAIAAFIEPGLGKDSACSALVREMNKNNGRTSADAAIPRNKP